MNIHQKINERTFRSFQKSVEKCNTKKLPKRMFFEVNIGGMAVCINHNAVREKKYSKYPRNFIG